MNRPPGGHRPATGLFLYYTTIPKYLSLFARLQKSGGSSWSALVLVTAARAQEKIMISSAQIGDDKYRIYISPLYDYFRLSPIPNIPSNSPTPPTANNIDASHPPAYTTWYICTILFVWGQQKQFFSNCLVCSSN